MKNTIWRCLGIGVVALAVWATPQKAAAQFTVLSGYDLFGNSTAVNDAVNYAGIPLGAFNFGGSIGTKNVGNTDTIVQRLDSVTGTGVGDTETTRLSIAALQLESTAMVNGHFQFFTLDPSNPSTGSMDITFGSPSGGTYNSFFDIFFDIHTDSLSGTVIGSGELKLTGTGATWGRNPPPGALTILGVNYDLDGKDTASDFWTSGSATPEPATILGLGGGVLLFCRMRRRGKARV